MNCFTLGFSDSRSRPNAEGKSRRKHFSLFLSRSLFCIFLLCSLEVRAPQLWPALAPFLLYTCLPPPSTTTFCSCHLLVLVIFIVRTYIYILFIYLLVCRPYACIHKNTRRLVVQPIHRSHAFHSLYYTLRNTYAAGTYYTLFVRVSKALNILETGPLMLRMQFLSFLFSSNSISPLDTFP